MTARHPVWDALAVVEAADAAAGLDDLPGLLLPALTRAFGADTAACTMFVGPPGAAVRSYHGYPELLVDQGCAAAFERHLGGFPLGLFTRPGGPGAPIRRSDLQSRRAYHASGMYAEVLRARGAEEMLAVALPLPELYLCLSMHRGGSDFRPAAVELLGQLRPLLARRVGRLSPRPARPPALTRRQREVLSLVGLGLTDVAIGHRLECSPRTVDKHLEHIYRQLGVQGRAAAVARWLGTRPVPD